MGGLTLPQFHVENATMLSHCVLFHMLNNEIRLQTLVELVVDMHTKIMSDCKPCEIRCFPFINNMSKSPQKKENWATSGQLEWHSRTYCRRRYQSPLVALLHWPRSGLGHHLRSSHQSRLTRRWWPGLWSQTFQHGQPEVEKRFRFHFL